MKILQMLLSQSEAGAETYFEKVAAAFQARPGLDQRLIIEAQASRERRLKAVSCQFDTLPMGFWGKRFLYNYQIERQARRFDPDIVFTWVNRASRKAPRVGKITVGRLGGYYDIANYQRCDHLVVNTPDLVRHVVESGWPREAVSMISNFGDLPSGLESPEALPELPEGAPLLLSLGRLHTKKAQDVLIRALPLIPKAHLLLAGSGELLEDYRALADSQKVGDRVHFLGLRKDVGALFKRCDVCVFPSRFEPLGNVVLEAWAMERPIVAAASVGPSWLIEHGTNGLLFPIDDHEACAKQVNRVLQESDLRCQLVAGGKARLAQSFSQDAIIDRYLALFDGLLRGSIATRSSAS